MCLVNVFGRRKEEKEGVRERSDEGIYLFNIICKSGAEPRKEAGVFQIGSLTTSNTILRNIVIQTFWPAVREY